MEGSHSIDDHHRETGLSSKDEQKKGGGWITFPFILVTMAGLNLVNGGWTSNLIVYLISEYKVKNIDAAQISNLVSGFGSLIPVLAAVIADSFLGCFSVIWISSFISLLGIILLFITSMLKSSTNSNSCDNSSSSLCAIPSNYQYALLYAGIALGTIGFGGVRSTLSTMGANQFNKPKNLSTFFNWFYTTVYISSVISLTVIVYIEDNLSWSWGFGLCVGVNAVSAAIFLFGNRLYHHVKPQGSPFTGIARVAVAAIRKRKVPISMEKEDYYHGVERKMKVPTVTMSFRFLNTAALTTEGDINADGSIAKPWNLCTLQQVEDFKILIRILPLWCTGIFLSTPIAIQAALSILQALNMDRKIGPHFKIPASSIMIFVMISSAISLTIFDRILSPACQYLIGRPLTHLQRIGIGHVLNVVSMAISAIIESKRLSIAHSNPLEPISALWLVPQLAVAGIGTAFHYPNQVALYYQEFPKPLKNLATAIVSLAIAISYYLSTSLIDLIRRVTEWLPEDLNQGRLDKAYWVIAVIALLNFGFYFVCAWFYKYQNSELDPEDDSSSTK